MTHPTVRIAMWSGPRNISTAMMRAWEARGDTDVWDEPLYAWYLQQTGLPHPGAEAIVTHDETDPDRLVARLTGPGPTGKAIFFQKHMAHHLLPGMTFDWIGAMRHAFLVRTPSEMITSLSKVIPSPTLEQTGLPQQVALFDRLVAEGATPAVVDSADVLRDPPAVLARLCAHLEVPYTDAMLSWPPGRRDTDGVWAEHWYAAVEQSTGFAPYRPKDEPVPDHLLAVVEGCVPLYDHLRRHALTPA